MDPVTETTAPTPTRDELRCSSKLHAVLHGAGVVEVKCDSRFCGAGKGIVVLHRFSTFNGELIETLKFADPSKE